VSHHTSPESRIGQAMGILMAVTQDPETPDLIRLLVGPHVDGLVAITEVIEHLEEHG
jgi:hypothetical protein